MKVEYELSYTQWKVYNHEERFSVIISMQDISMGAPFFELVDLSINWFDQSRNV